MTESIYTIALFVVSAGMTVIAGIFAYLYRERDEQFTEAATRCNKLTTLLEREEMLTRRLAQNNSSMSAELDKWKQLSAEQATTIDLLQSERATLYRRNAKGQIEPITPKPRKPHTLKHGMTVKDPTPAQAKRIFAEARKAGIEVYKEEKLGDEFPNIWFGNPSSVVMPTRSKDTDTYITPTEFIRRIRGEQE
jgi:hypothetical protein